MLTFELSRCESASRTGLSGCACDMRSAVPGVGSAGDGLGGVVLLLGGVVCEPLGVVWEALRKNGTGRSSNPPAGAAEEHAHRDEIRTTCPISWKPVGSFIPNTSRFFSLTSHS